MLDLSTWTIIGRNLPYILNGLEVTLLLSLASLVGSILFGACLAMLRMSPVFWLRWPAIIYIDMMRMIPLVMVIFWVFFLVPLLTGQDVLPVNTSLVALILFNSSYMAEVMRSGLQSVPRGLSEAARCSGMAYMQCMLYIVLPIALRSILPAIVSRLIAMVMGTSLASIIGVTEFFRAANNINNRVFLPYQIYSMVALVYFLLCFGLSMLGKSLQKRLSPDEGRAERPGLASA